MKAANTVPENKRKLNVLIYPLFKGSPKPLKMLDEIQKALDKHSHKLVQPGAHVGYLMKVA